MTRCPMCGSRKIKRRAVVETTQRGAKPVTIMVEVCPDCGERFYDLTAMQKLERERRRGDKRRTG